MEKKPRSVKDKRYEEKHKAERKAKNATWGTSVPREKAEQINAFLDKYGYTKVQLCWTMPPSIIFHSVRLWTDMMTSSLPNWRL